MKYIDSNSVGYIDIVTKRVSIIHVTRGNLTNIEKINNTKIYKQQDKYETYYCDYLFLIIV